jgi:hypothetical protein
MVRTGAATAHITATTPPPVPYPAQRVGAQSSRWPIN